MKLLRKGQMGGLQGFIIAIVTVAVILAIGLVVLQELRSTQTFAGGNTGLTACNTTTSNGCGAAYNSTGIIIGKLTTVPTWIGIIIVVALAFIVLSFFMGRGR